MNAYKKLAFKNPDKYPKNMGNPWDDDEVLLLLEEVRSGKDIKEIATIHERTEGAIKAALQRQALSYYFDQRMPIDEILNLTRLSNEVFQKALKKDKRYTPPKGNLLEILKETTEQGKLIPTGRKIKVSKKQPDDDSVVSLLKDIKILLQQVVEKLK